MFNRKRYTFKDNNKIIVIKQTNIFCIQGMINAEMNSFQILSSFLPTISDLGISS